MNILTVRAAQAYFAMPQRAAADVDHHVWLETAPIQMQLVVHVAIVRVRTATLMSACFVTPISINVKHGERAKFEMGRLQIQARVTVHAKTAILELVCFVLLPKKLAAHHRM